MLTGCNSELWIAGPMLAPLGFLHLWALITAVRYRNWLWLVALLAVPVLAAFPYFFFHLHHHGPTGFELPGALDRARLRRLEAELARIDKPHLHAQLGDHYYQLGKLDRALASYQAAHQRDPADRDIRAHLGQCLVRLGRAEEALPLLAGVVADQPRHDHGYTQMALAEAQAALGRAGDAIATWRQVTARHSYPRARVQLAELLAAAGDVAGARALLREVVDDDRTAPDFHRRRERVWVRRARRALRKLGGAN